MASKETILDRPLGGLFLMTLLTSVWVILSEYYFNNSDYRIVGLIFGAILIYFTYTYWRFSRKKYLLPENEKIEDPKKEKLYWIIFALEGAAIFIVNVILTNIGRDDLFISYFALIVGLHFIPLAKVFERKFDYYIGIWTILLSTIGIVLIFQKALDYRLVNALVCTGCAVSTTLYGLKMINDGRKIIARNIISHT
jgi:hypothetical protein